MAYRKVDDASLTSVANAIRQKGGTSGKLAFPNDFVSAIGSIKTGSGTPSAVLGTKNISENGTYYAVNDGYDGYSQVKVSVPTLEPSGTLDVSSNGIHDVTSYASVNVNVPASGVELPSLANPGAASDLLMHKQMIGADGKAVTGSMTNYGVVSETVDCVNSSGIQWDAGYFSSLSVIFDSTAIEALLDAL